MLYDNEDVKLWNPETGEMEVPDAASEEIQKLIDEGQQIELMAKHEGWKLVNGYISSCIESYRQKLSYEMDLKKVRRLQEALKAYINVLAFVDYKVSEARSLQSAQNEQQQTPPQEG
jgi:hypothetical protein